jgi:hypothetical protein
MMSLIVGPTFFSLEHVDDHGRNYMRTWVYTHYLDAPSAHGNDGIMAMPSSPSSTTVVVLQAVFNDVDKPV